MSKEKTLLDKIFETDVPIEFGEKKTYGT